MTNAMSTLNEGIPRKGDTPEGEQKMNPKFDAPIGLYKKPKDDSEDSETIRLRLRHVPTNNNSATYDKHFKVWDGTSPEEHCELRQELDTVYQNTPCKIITFQSDQVADNLASQQVSCL